ncbi:MAG: hypothetical protein QXI58_00495 [Candidatus Micrarchaeia archaeon]
MLKDIVEKRINLLDEVSQKIEGFSYDIEPELLIQELKKLNKKDEEITNLLALIALLKIDVLDDILVFDKIAIGLSEKPYINFSYPQLPKPAEIALFFALKERLRKDLTISEDVYYYIAFCLILYGLLVMPTILKPIRKYVFKICKMTKEELLELERKVNERWKEIEQKKPEELVFSENLVDIQLARLKAIQYYG